MPELVQAAQKHQEHLAHSGAREDHRRALLKSEVYDILAERLADSLNGAFGTSSGEAVLQELLDRRINPYEAADKISN